MKLFLTLLLVSVNLMALPDKLQIITKRNIFDATRRVEAKKAPKPVEPKPVEKEPEKVVHTIRLVGVWIENGESVILVEDNQAGSQVLKVQDKVSNWLITAITPEFVTLTDNDELKWQPGTSISKEDGGTWKVDKSSMDIAPSGHRDGPAPAAEPEKSITKSNKHESENCTLHSVVSRRSSSERECSHLAHGL